MCFNLEEVKLNWHFVSTSYSMVAPIQVEDAFNTMVGSDSPGARPVPTSTWHLLHHVAPCCTWCFAVHQNGHQNLASCLPAFQPAQRFFVVCIGVAMEAWPRLDPFHHFVVDASSYANFESMADRFLVQARESRLTPSQAAEPLSRRSSVSEGPGCAIPPNDISTQGAMTGGGSKQPKTH